LLVSAVVAVGPPSASADFRLRPSAAEPAIDVFRGVAATSPADAWIVGISSASETSRAHTLIAHWNGRTWQRVPSPDAPGRRTSSFLNAVAATSRRDAWAVGESNSGGGSTLIERWNGKAWKVTPSPSVRRHFNFLSAVAATSRNDAWAVGWVLTGPGSGTQTLIEHWNGTAWLAVPSPNVSKRDQNILNGVTVISPSDVWAVGDYFAGSKPPQTLIEHWNGTNWAIVPSTNPLGATSPDHLNGVSAVSPGDIFAVGDLGDVFAPTSTMILRWKGSSWKQVASPSSDTADESLLAVSAVSASDAWAVGSFSSQTSSESPPLILRWNGAKWRAVRTPVPHGSISNDLTSVAAISAKSAWAVGSTQGGPRQGPLLLRWNGARWTVVAVSFR